MAKKIITENEGEKEMSHWNYRICKQPDGHYSLNEVYYDDKGKEKSVTANPVSFVTYDDEGPEGIVKSLERALQDARERPLFVVPKKWKD
jgi:hypothetical protein